MGRGNPFTGATTGAFCNSQAKATCPIGTLRFAATSATARQLLCRQRQEEVIALGCRKFIACGGAGGLDREIALGHLLVPTCAIRDEGTSYHYLPPAREVAAHPAAVAAIETVLQQHKVDYLLTKSWTTDALYRETQAKATQRRAEGCLAVEMEAATLFAIAQFRGLPLGQILYGGDNLAGEVWDSRGWYEHWTVREKLVALAAEAWLLL